MKTQPTTENRAGRFAFIGRLLALLSFLAAFCKGGRVEPKSATPTPSVGPAPSDVVWDLAWDDALLELVFDIITDYDAPITRRGAVELALRLGDSPFMGRNEVGFDTGDLYRTPEGWFYAPHYRDPQPVATMGELRHLLKSSWA